MSLPANRNDFKERCLEDLGAPVVSINVTDKQVENKIDEALQFWRDYHYNAVERKYLTFQLTQQMLDDKQIPLPATVIGVSRVLTPVSLGTSNDVLSASYQLTTDLVLQASRQAYAGGIIHYWITNQYLQTVQSLFERVPLQEFRVHKGLLEVFWDWSVRTTNDFVVMEVIAYLDETVYAKVWTDRMLRKYATALIKKQWGENISKFAGVQLPGGITIDGPRIVREANDEIDQLEKDFIQKYSEPDQFWMG